MCLVESLWVMVAGLELQRILPHPDPLPLGEGMRAVTVQNLEALGLYGHGLKVFAPE
jgi:hypothetical protein